MSIVSIAREELMTGVLDFGKAIHSFFSFWKSVFSEDGEGSYSRCAAGTVVIAAVAWVTHVVWKTNAIPDLTGISAFVVSCAGVHYGLNKASEIVGAFKGTNGPTDQQPSVVIQNPAPVAPAQQ